jgi:hypothetical protein
MINHHDLLDKYQALSRSCLQVGMDIDLEFGDQVSYQGKRYVVAAARGDRVALVDDYMSVPLNEEAIIYVTNWLDDPACVYLPSIEQLLEIIHERTNLYPTLVSGIKEIREVWQITHPNSQPIVAESLEEGLLELSIRVIENELSSANE